MSILVSCQNISKSYAGKQLFEDLNFGIFAGERLGIVGPNGCGKSTFLKLLADLDHSDSGQITRKRGLHISYIPQQQSFPQKRTILEVVKGAALQAGINVDKVDTQVSITLTKVGFLDHHQRVESLSGGWQKRLGIVCGLVSEPDLLLLDEPTNHLDLEGIIWLEELLRKSLFSWLLVSHDRYFLERTVAKIVEINSCYSEGYFMIDGGYHQFLEQRIAYAIQQEKAASSLATKVKRENAWLAVNPKARTTKSKSRIDEAMRLRENLSALKSRLKDSKTAIDFTATGRKTRELVRLIGVQKAFGDKKIVNDLSIVIVPGKILGILGGNGTGKTTILKLINKELTPDKGQIFHCADLKIAYFDQNRQKLDPNKSLRMTLSESGNSVIYRGQAIHINSWAARFQFHQSQLEAKISELSGGECARVMIAKLMLQQADILLLDEPTNDLDIQTLELLEENLMNFPGAIVLITHDRYMLERLCDYFIGLDGEGGAHIYADYGQWETNFKAPKVDHRNLRSKKSPDKKPSKAVLKTAPKKLTYKEKLEFEQMEETILNAEKKVQDCESLTNDPTIIADPIELGKAYIKLKAAQDEVEKLYARWAELEAKLP